MELIYLTLIISLVATLIIEIYDDIQYAKLQKEKEEIMYEVFEEDMKLEKIQLEFSKCLNKLYEEEQ